MAGPSSPSAEPDSLARGVCLHPADNVATMLVDGIPGTVSLLGETKSARIEIVEPVSRGHKVALRSIAAGQLVVKFGVAIGTAAADIAAGAWVHTHNCSSRFDARSATLDRHTGAPTDTQYE